MQWLGMPWVAYGIGFAFSILVGYVILEPFAAAVRRSRHGSKDASIPNSTHHAALMGLVERPLYTASYLLGFPEFIGLWLILKTAVKWSVWYRGSPGADSGENAVEEDMGVSRTSGDNTIEGKFYYYDFLSATALSLAFGVLGGVISKLLIGSYEYPDRLWEALCAGLGLVVFSLLLTVWLTTRAKRSD